MSSEPPITAPTGDLPSKPKRRVVDESNPSSWLNATCFVLPLAACWFGPRNLSFFVNMFWPVFVVACFLLYGLVRGLQERRVRWAYCSLLFGLFLGSYMVVREHSHEFNSFLNALP